MTTDTTIDTQSYRMMMGLRSVLAIGNELLACPDMESTLRQAVEAARDRLGLERCAIFLERDGYLVGTYGTDDRGRTTDEKGFRIFLNADWNARLERLKPEEAQWIAIEDTYTYGENGSMVKLDKTGWIVWTRILFADGSRGILCNDGGMTGAPLDEVKQEIVAVFCSLLGNILTHKKVEEDIRRALDKERELGVMKSRFIANVSHEFRTPMAVIQSSADLLLSYGERMSDAEKRSRLIKIGDQIRMMVALLDDALTINRADKVGLVCQPVPVDLVAFAGELLEKLHATARESHRIRFSHNGNCSSCTVDKNLLRHILTSLLSNAIKYSPRDSEIVFDATCEAERVVFTIKDAGIGIPPQDQPHLFLEFYRASNVGVISGTGLGLSIAKRAVEAHSGTIAFESEVGIGTTFTVIIPLSRCPSESPASTD